MNGSPMFSAARRPVRKLCNVSLRSSPFSDRASFAELPADTDRVTWMEPLFFQHSMGCLFVLGLRVGLVLFTLTVLFVGDKMKFLKARVIGVSLTRGRRGLPMSVLQRGFGRGRWDASGETASDRPGLDHGTHTKDLADQYEMGNPA